MKSVLCSGILILGLSACAASERMWPAPDETSYPRAEIAGYEDIRFFVDETPVLVEQFVASRREIIKQNPSLAIRQDGLALSGGAEDGAYGAGFLKGWTDRGDRPEFTWVTGISTGALMAPFAFLGSDYDDEIERFYKETTTDDLVLLKPFQLLLGASAVADSAPLRATIRREVDADLVAAIARESRRGRLLLIGTTNLDAQRHMIWNIGKIAESGRADAPELIGNILLASASIPGAFPPVKFDVIVDGKKRQELHVDGGITHQIFAYPDGIPVRQMEAILGIAPTKTMWVIRNTKIDPDYQETGLGVASIVGRSINTLTKYQGIGDLNALERLAKRDGFDFRLAYVPASFDVPYVTFFDRDYMVALFGVGYAAARSDAPWAGSVAEIINGKARAGLN